MERKLIKQGGGGFTIYLPKKWIDEKNLKAGDNVNIKPLENNLIISPTKSEIKSETEINLTGMAESSVRTLITNAYRIGYDKIKVNFSSESQFKAIRETTEKDLLGFEIIKKEEKYCIIENITEPSAEHFENIIRKMLYNTTDLIKNTELRLKNKKAIENYKEIETRIKKYDNFCKRVTGKNSFEKDSKLLWIFLTLFTHAQREIYLLNQFLDENEINMKKETIGLFSKLNSLFEKVKESYLKKEMPHLEEIHKMEKEYIYGDAYKLLSAKKGKENIVIYRIASSIRKFYLATSPLMGLFLGQ